MGFAIPRGPGLVTTAFDQGLARCPLVQYVGAERTCHWCGGELPKRRSRWCSDECSNAYGNNHWWTPARAAALARDGYRCTECGVLGWADVPASLLWVEVADRDLDPHPTTREHWAIAFGLLDRADYEEHYPWKEEPARWRRLRKAADDLPESIQELVRREHKPDARTQSRWARGWSGGARHQLEVDHIRPVRGGPRDDVCENHQDNLRTLCRAHHTEVTRLQIVSARSYGGGSRTIACWEGSCDACWLNLEEEAIGCVCPHHRGEPWDDPRPPSRAKDQTIPLFESVAEGVT